MSEFDHSTGQGLHIRLDAIVERAVEILSADGGAIVLIDDQQDQPMLEAVRGLSVAEVASFQQRRGAAITAEVLSTGQPGIHNNLLLLTSDPSGRKTQINACVSIPLKAREKIIGALQIYGGAKASSFHVEDVEVIDSLAREASLAVENARLSQMEREQQRRTGVLLEIARATTSTLELQDVLDQVAKQTAILTGADRCSIWLLDRDGDHVTSAAIYGIDSEFAANWRRRNLQLIDESLSREALATLQPVVVFDAETDPRTDKRAVRFFGDRSILVVPLVYKDTQLGTLFLNHIREQHFYSSDEIESVQAIASQASVAIQNAKLYEDSKQKSIALENSFNQVGMALASASSVDEILQLVVDAIVDLLHSPYCGIQLYDEATQELTFRISRGIPSEFAEASRVKLGEGLGGKVFAEGKPLHLEYSDAEMETLPPISKRLGVRGYIGVPLFVKGKAIGVLGVYSTQSGQLSNQDLELLRSFANQAAVGLEKAELFDETRRRAHDLALLQDASMAINSSLELDEILNVVLTNAMRLTEADIGSLFVIDEDNGQIFEKLTIPAEKGYGAEIRSKGLTSKIIQTGEAIVIADVRIDERVNQIVVERKVRSVLGMPVKAGQRIMGVLYLHSERPHHFTEGHRGILTVMTNQAAVALRNASLYYDAVQEKDKLAAIFRNSTDGILLMDADRRILDLNLALERLAGWKTGEVVGFACEEVFGCLDMKGNPLCQAGCPMSADSATGESVPYVELSLRRKDGDTVQVAASCSQIPSPYGDTWLWVSIMRDITEAKKVEQIKSDFVAIVSHEMRTPLSIVKGYSSTMLRHKFNFDMESIKSFVTSIDDAANRMTRLLNDLLSISRIELGKLELHWGRFDISEAIAKAAEECSVGRSRSHRFVLQLWPGGITVFADRVRIEEVLQNLLDNAMKYSAPGSTVTIRSQLVETTEVVKLRTLHAGRALAQAAPAPLSHQNALGAMLSSGRPIAPSKNSVLIAVADQGIGLTAEQRRHVFEKFYRAEGGLTRKTSGLGLGLFLSMGLIEAHGGYIWVDSAPMEGSVFYFSIPLIEEAVSLGLMPLFSVDRETS